MGRIELIGAYPILSMLGQILRPFLWLFWVYMGLHIFMMWDLFRLVFWAPHPILFWVVVLAGITLIAGLIEAIAILFLKPKSIQHPKASVFFGCLGFVRIIELYAIVNAYDASWSLQTVFPIAPTIFTTIILVIQSCTSLILLMYFSRRGSRLLLISLLLWELIFSYSMGNISLMLVNDSWP